MPPRIRNFGAGTPRLNEGIIVSGSDDQNYAIYASGSVHAEMLLLDTTLPVIQFKEGGSDRAEILINDSDNLVITNQSSNRHIVFKANDAGTVREGLRLDGAVPEVVVNQTQDSLVNFRVESENNTHMLFVTGSDKVGIGTSDPQSELHVNGTVLLSGSAGTELLRLSKGNAETREIVFENDGTDIASIFCNAAESLRLKSEKVNGNIVFQVNSGGSIENLMFLDGANLRAGINNVQPQLTLDVTGDVGISNHLALSCDGTSDPSLYINHAHIYSKLVNGHAEIFVRDSNGNVTQISPHTPEGEWQYFSRNTVTGKVVRVNMEKMIRKLEEITGESFMEEWYEDPSE